MFNFPRLDWAEGRVVTNLTLFRKSQDLLAARFSGTKNLDQILWRSRNALAESEDSAAFASLKQIAKRCGTGPLATSPSNIVVRRGHSAARTVGTVSLGRKGFSPDSGY
jgi:hypothetical protein